jgi:hypothetical protein
VDGVAPPPSARHDAQSALPWPGSFGFLERHQRLLRIRPKGTIDLAW